MKLRLIPILSLMHHNITTATQVGGTCSHDSAVHCVYVCVCVCVCVCACVHVCADVGAVCAVATFLSLLLPHHGNTAHPHYPRRGNQDTHS